MDLVKLTESIVKSLVVNEDSVSVKEFPTEEENVMLIQVMVAEEDMGRVIGKGGKCANALRTLVQASSSLESNKYVYVNNTNTYQGVDSSYYKTLHNKFNIDNMVLIGDQLFTDIAAAKKMGIKSILVDPIDVYEPFITVFNRGRENELINRGDYFE